MGFELHGGGAALLYRQAPQERCGGARGKVFHQGRGFAAGLDADEIDYGGGAAFGMSHKNRSHAHACTSTHLLTLTQTQTQTQTPKLPREKGGEIQSSQRQSRLPKKSMLTEALQLTCQLGSLQCPEPPQDRIHRLFAGGGTRQGTPRTRCFPPQRRREP